MEQPTLAARYVQTAQAVWRLIFWPGMVVELLRIITDQSSLLEAVVVGTGLTVMYWAVLLGALIIFTIRHPQEPTGLESDVVDHQLPPGFTVVRIVGLGPVFGRFNNEDMYEWVDVIENERHRRYVYDSVAASTEPVQDPALMLYSSSIYRLQPESAAHAAENCL